MLDWLLKPEDALMLQAVSPLVLTLSLFLVTAVTTHLVMSFGQTSSFYTHVFFDKEYHSERSRLRQFAWFRRKQEPHFVHHRHADSNFAVIHFFWDRVSPRTGSNMRVRAIRH